MMNLGKMHDEGIGVDRAPREAARFVLNSLRAGAWTMLDQVARLSEDTRREIQDQLRQAGYYVGPLDGRMGPETRAAMVEFARAGS
jgi:TPR repeat protein